MIRELFTQDLSLWTCLWQSTAFVALGLVAGRLLRRRPSRAYQVLLFAMMAAVAVPLLSAVVKHFDLGAFVATQTELPRVSPEVVLDGFAEAPEAALMDTAPPEFISAQAAEPASFSISWRTVMLYGWMAATLVLLGRLVATFLYGVYLVRHASPKQCEPVQQAADRARSKLGIACGLQVRISGRIRSPIVWCWSHLPILLVPNDCDDAEVDWTGVVAHELAHCRRRDHVTGLVAEVAASLLPWNPLMWVSKRHLVRLGEQACDDWVVAAGAPSEDYAESLLRFRPQRQMAFLPAVVHSKRGLAARIRRILSDACGDPRTGTRWGLAAAVLALCVGLTVAFAQARPAGTETGTEQEDAPAESLCDAASAGDLEGVKRLIASGADVDETSPQYADVKFTPLMAAANRGHAPVVQVLLENGAEVNATDFQGWTALYYAFWIFPDEDNEEKHRERAKVVKALIASGADVNKQCQGISPLINAITTGTPRLGSVEALLDAGADIHSKDDNGLTPLYWAAFAGNRNVLDLILERGDYANTIHLAACRGDLSRVRALIQEGTNVNTKDEFGCTPLHWAGLADSPEVAEFLISRGADVNVTAGPDNLTPLKAARGLPVIELLVAKGVDVRSQENRTKLHDVCSAGDMQVAKFLIDNGADIDAENRGGATPLWVAAASDQKEIAEFLLKEGADIDALDGRRRSTPLWIAARNGNKETVALLIEKGANLQTPDNEGRTPLAIAKQRGHTEIVDILREHGAKEESSAAPEDTRPMGDNDPSAARVEQAKTPAKSLHEAAADGDIEQVRKLTAQGADVNAKGEKGQTVLHYAVENGHREVAELLIAQGADVNAGGYGDGTPLLTAIFRDNIDMVRFLIAKGANCNVYDQRGNTPLVYAITAMGEKDKEIVEVLIAAGADINLENKQGQRTPLHWGIFDSSARVFDVFLAKVTNPDTIHLASLKGDLPKVTAFVQGGIDVNTKDRSGCTPLHWAVLAATGDVADSLLAKGADINAKDNTGRTPLVCARRLDMVRRLVSHGADVDAKGDLGWTALHRACFRNDEDTAAFLISEGADVNVRNNRGGMTPLLLASRDGHRDLAALLIARGADVNARFWNGSPLFAAATAGHADVVRLLIAKGAEVNASDNRGRTPLSRARKEKHTEVVDILRQHGAVDALHAEVAEEDIDAVNRLLSQGADINAKDNRGATPLWIAARNGQTELVEFLIAKGADINAPNNQGRTPLAIAKQRGHTAAVEMLRKHGAKETLHGAAGAGDLDEVRRLISHGVDIESKDEDGRTALHIVCKEGHTEIAKFLIAKGADVNARDGKGLAPLWYAKDRGDTEMVELLRKHGAKE